MGRYNPSVETNYFPNTVSSDYWSSTTNANDTSNAWYVNFNDGGGDWYGKDYGYPYVRAVRGGQ